jgi:DNA-binding NtrC family response regulator
MVPDQNVKVLLVERDQHVAEAVTQVLKNRPYELNILTESEEIEHHLKKNLYGLALAGDAGDGRSPFDIMKDIVRTSPMTSLILITDLPGKKVFELAEGYGILGSVDRSIPQKTLIQLLDIFNSIIEATATPATD